MWDFELLSNSVSSSLGPFSRSIKWMWSASPFKSFLWNSRSLDKHFWALGLSLVRSQLRKVKPQADIINVWHPLHLSCRTSGLLLSANNPLIRPGLAVWRTSTEAAVVFVGDVSPFFRSHPIEYEAKCYSKNGRQHGKTKACQRAIQHR